MYDEAPAPVAQAVARADLEQALWLTLSLQQGPTLEVLVHLPTGAGPHLGSLGHVPHSALGTLYLNSARRPEQRSLGPRRSFRAAAPGSGELSGRHGAFLITLGAVRVDLDGRSVSHANGTHRLTPREAQALAYLLGRRGQTISRRELEREVWGLRAGVRSETVPVTLRRLRAKLEPDPATPVHLLTVPKVGWRIPAPPDTWTTLPRFGSPTLPRPEQEQAVHALFEQGWKVVCVVGQAGLGKTRLCVSVAQNWPQGAVFVAAESCRSAEELEAAFAAALDLDAADPASLARGLSLMGCPLLLVDAVEATLPALSPLLQACLRLPEQRVLLSSQRAPPDPQVACHALAPMDSAQGSAFLRARLQASRWGPAPDTDLAAVVRALDGLPLALELVAAQPGGVLSPESAGLSGLSQALTRAWDLLDADAQTLLCQLSLWSIPLSREDVRAMDASEASFTALCERSWLSFQSGRWGLLNTTQRFVRAQPADWPEMTQRAQRWLVARCQAWGDAVLSTPQEVLRAWTPWLPAISALVDAGPLPLASALLLPCRQLYKHLGRHRAYNSLLQRAQDRGVDTPALHAMRLSELRPPGYTSLWTKIAPGDARTRSTALSALIASHDPLPPGALDQALAELPPQAPERHTLRLYQLYGEMVQHPGAPTPELLQALTDLARDSAGLPVMLAGVQQIQSMAQLRAAWIPQAMDSADRAVANAKRAQHAEVERTSTTQQVLTLAIRRPQEAAARARWAHRETLRRASSIIISKAACRAGVCAWLAGDQGAALHWMRQELEMGSALPARHRPLMAGFLAAAQAQPGAPGPVAEGVVTSLAGLLALEPLLQGALAQDEQAAEELSTHLPPNTLLGTDALTLAVQARLERLLAQV